VIQTEEQVGERRYVLTPGRRKQSTGCNVHCLFLISVICMTSDNIGGRRSSSVGTSPVLGSSQGDDPHFYPPPRPSVIQHRETRNGSEASKPIRRSLPAPVEREYSANSQFAQGQWLMIP